MKKFLITAYALFLTSVATFAQLSTNPDKFLGNITTSYNVDPGGGAPQFYKVWNQITCENESKWSSVEGTRGVYNWSGGDKAADYAAKYHFPFKFHTFVWGGQYPGWMDNLSLSEQYSSVVKWMDAAKEHYPDLEIIDVVNEAIQGHAPAPYRAALGGEGRTGFDWIIKAFELAYERWPNAILVYNDYNTFRWQKTEFINLVRTLRDYGAPVDAYGCQSHDLTDMGSEEFYGAMDEIQEALKMPMYSTEYDIGTYDDNLQLQRYKEQIPYFWEADYCAGITIWGWIYGRTWTSDGNSGLIRNGKERPALTWLREYMETEAAKNAKSPYPNFKKEASIYVHPAAMKVAKNDVLPIKVRAAMAEKTIEKIDLYVGDELIATMTEEPYIAYHEVGSSSGTKTVKAVVTTTDGATYERLARFTVANGSKREPYNETAPVLPGVIQAEEYDKGMTGVSYNKVTRDNFTTTSVKDGAWMEYTVDVAEDGYYVMEAEVASTKTGGTFHLSEYGFDNLTFYSNFAEVPNTGSSTEFKTVRCPLTKELKAGRHILCLNIDKGGFFIKSMNFKRSTTFELPGTIEAEDYFNGDCDIVATADGYALGNASSGSWAEYVINVTQAGKYSYEANVSSAVDGSQFSIILIENDGTEKSLINVSVPNTGSKDTYEVKTGKIRNVIPAGQQKLRFKINSGNCNIDNVKFICTETGIDEVTRDDMAAGASYNLSGQQVDAGYKGIIIRNGKKIVNR